MRTIKETWDEVKHDIEFPTGLPIRVPVESYSDLSDEQGPPPRRPDDVTFTKKFEAYGVNGTAHPVTIIFGVRGKESEIVAIYTGHY
jgi:hypothetical protein